MWGVSDHPKLGCRKDSKLVISLDEDDNSEQPTGEPSYFLQPLYCLGKYHILKKSFLILGPLPKQSVKDIHVNFHHFHMKVKRTMLGAAQPRITSVMFSLRFYFPSK